MRVCVAELEQRARRGCGWARFVLPLVSGTKNLNDCSFCEEVVIGILRDFVESF